MHAGNFPSETEPRRSSKIRKFPGQRWKGSSAFTAQIADDRLAYSQATNGKESKMCLTAVQSEMDSLYKNKTWALVPGEQDTNILTCKWVFKRKDAINENGGEFVKHKARLVTRGFQQRHGVDFDETSAPVVKYSTLRMFFSLAATEDLKLHQMDVKSAFLNGDLNGDIHMTQPEDFVDNRYPEYVCKLIKALYGLKPAPQNWFEKMNEILCKIAGFESCPYDPCFYVKRSGNEVLMITLYVDDL